MRANTTVLREQADCGRESRIYKEIRMANDHKNNPSRATFSSMHDLFLPVV